MKCPHCNQLHPDETDFCLNLGKKIFKIKVAHCNKCNSIYKLSDKFCAVCGEKLVEVTKCLPSSLVPLKSQAGPVCPICKRIHYSTSSFCSENGGKLIGEQTCQNISCRKKGIPITAKFCPKCGSAHLAKSYKTDPQYLSYKQHCKIVRKEKINKAFDTIGTGARNVGKALYMFLKLFGG